MALACALVSITGARVFPASASGTLPATGDFTGTATTNCTQHVDLGTVKLTVASGHALVLKAGCSGHIHELDIVAILGDPLHIGAATNLVIDNVNFMCFAPPTPGFHQDGTQVLGGADNVQIMGGYIGCYSANNSQAMFHTAGGSLGPPNNVVFHNVVFDPSGVYDPTRAGGDFPQYGLTGVPVHGDYYWGPGGAYGLSNGESTNSGYECVSLLAKSNLHDLWQDTTGQVINPKWSFMSLPVGVVDNFGGAYTMCDVTPPSSPPNLRLTDGSQESAVTVDWDAATDDFGVTGYHVSVDGVAQPDGTKSFPGLTWGSHTIAVTAYDAAGNVSAPTSLTVTSAWRAG